MKKYLLMAVGTALIVTQPLALNTIGKTGVEINVNDNIKLDVGDTYRLKITSDATKSVSNKLMFSTSDSLTADIDTSGKIEATGSGKATIIVRSRKNRKILSKCTVLVKKPSPITISLICNQAPPAKNNVLYNLIKRKLGVTFKINYFSSNLDEKTGIMIASGDYTDIIGSNQKLIDAKAEIPLEGLIDKYAPNLKNHLRPYYNQLKDPKDGHLYYMVANGRIYGKPTLTEPFGTGFFIQKAVLKEYGYPKIKTLDEYFNLIKKYKLKHPKIEGEPTIGYEIENYDWRNFGLVNPPQFLAGYPNDGNVIVGSKTHKAQIFANKDIMKRFVKKLNQINSMGLLDSEAFILNHDQYIAKLAVGNVLGFCDQKWNMNTANESLYARGKIERQYVGIPLVFGKGIKPRYIDAPQLNISNGWAITRKCKNPIRVIKFFNTIMTEAWQKRIQWGEKGKDYLVDSKGMFYRTDAMRKAQADTIKYNRKYKVEGLFQNSPKMEGTYSDGNPCAAWQSPTEFYAGLNSYDKKFLDGYGYKCWADFYGKAPKKNPPYYPCWNIPLETKSSASIAIVKIKDIQMQTLPKLIMSKPSQFESLWHGYLNSFSAIDVGAYEKKINEGIKWRMKHWAFQ